MAPVSNKIVLTAAILGNNGHKVASVIFQHFRNSFRNRNSCLNGTAFADTAQQFVTIAKRSQRERKLTQLTTCDWPHLNAETHS